MGWSVGYDSRWKRDVGSGVPATCDQPGCLEEIDRGLSFVCGGEPYGGEHGCGLYFCHLHRRLAGPAREHASVCCRCYSGRSPFAAKPDTLAWMRWKLQDASWAAWRRANPEIVARLQGLVAAEDSPAVAERRD